MKIKRSEGQSFAEMGEGGKVSFLKIFLMAREWPHLKAEISTREKFKRARRMGLASTFIQAGANMMAAGTRIRSMEYKSSDGLMGAFSNFSKTSG
jgi:hypothetical protein